MEKLIKNVMGQWKLMSEIATPDSRDMFKLNKSIKAPIDTSHNEKLTGLFNSLNEAGNNKDHDGTKEWAGEIKSTVLSADKGSIDLGHLNNLYMSHKKNRINNTPEVEESSGDDFETNWHQRSEGAFRRTDLAEAFNRHAGDTRSLKQFHGKHGDDGLKGLMNCMGANGDPIEYSMIKLGHNAHADLLDLVNPGKAKENREWHREKGVLPKSPFHNTEIDAKHWDDVNKTYDDLHPDYDDPNEGNHDPAFMRYDKKAKELTHAHNNAVTDRGMALFNGRYKKKE